MSARSNPRALGILCFIVFIDLLGFGLVIPLLPFYATELGASPTAIGLLASSFSLMQLFFLPFWGRVSDRIGRRKVILISVFGSLISYFLFSLAHSFAWLLASRALAGVTGANLAVAQAFLADLSTEEERPKVMGYFGAAFALGFLLGPVMGGVLSKQGYAAPGWVAAGLCAVGLVCAALGLPESTPASHPNVASGKGPSTRAYLIERPALLGLIAMNLLSTAAFSHLFIAFPLFTASVFNYGAMENGYLFAVLSFVGIVIQGGLIGPLARRFGQWRLVATGIALMSISMIGLGYLGGLPSLLLAVVGMGVGYSLLSPSLTSLITLQTSADSQGRVAGVSQAAAGLGRIVGPATAGILIQHVGIRSPFLSGTIFLLATLAAFLATPRRQAPGN